MDVGVQAREARREAGRLEQLARAARERGGDHCCRDLRALEHRLIERAAVCEERARLLEAAVQRRRS